MKGVRKNDEVTPFFQAGGLGTFGALVNEYMEWLRMNGQSEVSVQVRVAQLGRFMTWCGDRGIVSPREVSLPILERYQRHMFNHRQRNGKPLSFRSQATRICLMRSFFKWLTRKRYIPFNPAAELMTPKVGYSLPRVVLDAREVEAVLAVPDLGEPLGIRDRTILETFYSTGMRRMELVRLKIDDLDLNLGTAMIRQGKGKKDRVVPLGKRAILFLEKYLYEVRPELSTGTDDGQLFLTHLGLPFTGNGMTRQVRDLILKANLGKRGSCHLFRHTMATLMLENGADVRFVQEILGHASLVTTQIYTHVSIKRLKMVHEKTHPAELSFQPVASQAPEDPATTETTPAAGPTLAEVIFAFMTEKRARTTGRTLELYEDHLSRFNLWYGALPLTALRATLAAEYIRRRKEEGIFENTISREIQDFNAVLRYAHDQGHLVKPLRFEGLPRKENLRPIRIVDPEEFEKALSHVEYPHARLFLRLMRYMGLRKSEARYLRHEWIDEKKGFLTVRSDEFFKTKTQKPRILKIPAPLFAEYQALPRLSEWACPSSQDPAIPIRDVRKTLTRACRAAQVRPFTLKDLRHSFNTTLAEKGVSSKVRAVLMGHTTTAMTDNVYTQAREKALEEAMDLSMTMTTMAG